MLRLFNIMRKLDFVVLSLAIWRLSNMLVGEDGPWLVFEHLRLRVGLQPPQYPNMMRDTDPPGQMPGTLFSCVWCISFWIAGIFAALYALKRNLAFWLSLPLALSAVSCIIDRWSNK